MKPLLIDTVRGLMPAFMLVKAETEQQIPGGLLKLTSYYKDGELVKQDAHLVANENILPGCAGVTGDFA